MKKYRVIIWGLGSVGQYALKMITTKKSLELVGVIDTDPAKIGRDAGEVCGYAPTGIIVSGDIEASLKLEADVVLLYVDTIFHELDPEPTRYAPTADLVCQALQAKKNVLTPTPIYYFKKTAPQLFAQVNNCALENEVTFTQQGIFPGLYNPYLPVVLASMTGQTEKVLVYSGEDDAYNTSSWVNIFGYGKDPHTFDAEGLKRIICTYYGPAVMQIAERVGIEYDEYIQEHKMFTAQVEMNPPCGLVKPGTISAHAFDMYCLKDGIEVTGFHFIHKVCHKIQPEPPLPKDRIEIIGEPNLEITIRGMLSKHVPYASSAAPSVNLIPQVVGAAPGFVDSLDLPASKPIL